MQLRAAPQCARVVGMASGSWHRHWLYPSSLVELVCVGRVGTDSVVHPSFPLMLPTTGNLRSVPAILTCPRGAPEVRLCVQGEQVEIGEL